MPAAAAAAGRPHGAPSRRRAAEASAAAAARRSARADAAPQSGAGLLAGLVGIAGRLLLLLAVGAGAVSSSLRAEGAGRRAVAPPVDDGATRRRLADAPPVTTVPPVAATAAPSAAPAPVPQSAGVIGRAARARTPRGGEPARPADAGPPVTAPPRDRAARAATRSPTCSTREPPQVDGREAGERAAEGYRSDQRRRAPAAPSAPSRPLPRAREVPARRHRRRAAGVFVLLNVIHYQALHRQRTGRYGTFKEVLPRQVTSPNSLRPRRLPLRHDRRVGRLQGRRHALGHGLRGFVADDSGFVRYADE